MRCSKCGAEGTSGRKFCSECGSPLSNRCAKCGADNSPSAKFCEDCGAAFGSPAAVAAKKSDEPQIRIADAPAENLDGERKTVTALFADIKGSTELMEDLDPENARAIIDPALKLMIDAAHRYDGYVVQSTGDGIFALFGAPVAHEDHPQRALYAALRMQEEMSRYSAKVVADGGMPIEARIGANTGEVVVRSIATGSGHVEYTPIGHTTNLAARMQAVAPTGSIAISEQTRKFVEGYFQLKPMGPTKVKGVSEPVNVYEVTGLGPLRTRLQRSAGRGLTKFVGRQREMESLSHAAELARTGRGQIVAAMAEAGTGKSRLYFEFKAKNQSGWMVLEAFSVSHGKASAYLPVIDLLKSYFKVAPEDDERARREKVAGKIVMLDRALEDTLPYLFGLLGIVEGDDPLVQLDPQLRRRRTLEAIKRILLRESLSQPLIVEFEDLHWIDSETQALLNLLVDGVATARILLLVNYRPEYHHQWGSKTYYTQLRLDPLGKGSAQELLTALMGDDESTLPLKRLIIERTEGNPFFMEEMVQALFEQGALARNGAVKLVKPLNEIRVPPTVQAILASRIDRLPAAEKELLQTVAVVGREFSSRLIKQVAGKSDDELERMLAALQLAEFIYEQPAMGDVEYTFKHALTLEVAYNSVLTERRRLLHERAAQAMEALFSDRLEDHLTELAHHYERSGNAPEAVEYLGRAGARAARQVAHAEAIGYFNRALEMLRRLPESTTRDGRELDLQIALSWSSFVAKGPRAPERESALVRARELCERLGDNAKLMAVLLELAHYRANRRDLEHSRELNQRVLSMARQAESRPMLGAAYFGLGTVLLMMGEFQAGREHLESAVELLDGGMSPENGGWFALNPQYLLTLPTVLLILGYPSTAFRKSGELLRAARRSPDPYSRATGLFVDSLTYLVARESRMVAERAREILSIAAEHDLPLFLPLGTALQGWTMAAEGRTQEGITQMRQGLSDPLVAEAVGTMWILTELAETYGKNGHAEEGLELVANGLETTERTGLRNVEAELHRIEGELLMSKHSGNTADAERCFRIAIDVARRQSARLLELRATVGLARLLKQQGKTDEARRMLAEIYNWFTEGFDSADLKDAKALLDELATVA